MDTISKRNHRGSVTILSEFEYKIHPSLYVQVTGPLDAASMDNFSSQVIERIEESSESVIIIDLNGLQAINSLGLGAIIRIWKSASDSGKSVRILANQRISHVFRVARLTQIIDVRTIESGAA